MKGIITQDKWHFKLGLLPTFNGSNRIFIHFGIFKLIKFPPEGMVFTSDCYKGFWLRKEWKGFEISF